MAINSVNTKELETDAKRTSGEDVIRCQGLTKRYRGGTIAVDSLDLSVHPCEIFGLLGPNGAGKTTTVGMLTTLVTPTAGKAFIDGVDIGSDPAFIKQMIGVVSQTNNLDRALTVWENLYYHGRYFGMSARESREAADQFLVEFRLTEKAKADISAISGGMAKRLQVARALLHRPRVLFLDEPTAGLDPQTRLALWEILGKLRAGGQTILLTTHYMEEADSVCDRLVIMDHGKILAMGTPKELKESVGADTVVTISATGDLNALAVFLKDRIEGVTRSFLFDNKVQLDVKGAIGLLPRVLAVAGQGGFNVTDISVKQPTLETVFIKFTGKELRE
jgi:ABC-2 type transport system ATP-binding protein